jgi:DNA replication and repair protein RecF
MHATTFAVTRLTLTDFRNYVQLRLEPSRPLVALAGANGAGKTNLLEAVSLLSPGRGLRGVEFQALARQGGSGHWAVAANVLTPQGDMQLGTAWQPGEDGEASATRSVMIDGLAQRSAGSLAGLVRMVWLTPAMDRLFQGAPGDRRRFLDRMVMLFDAGHASRAASFEKLMRERNALLAENSPDPAWLASIEVQMAESAVAVAAARISAVTTLARHLGPSEHQGPFPWADLAITGAMEDLVIAHPAVEAEDIYRQQLAKGRNLDRAAGRALAGPHRSDLRVTHGPKAMAAELCSTGEQKALLIGLILAQALAAKSLFGASPMLLLDEIAAHLDPARRTSLFRLLESLQSQVFMTGTEASLFDGAGASAVVYQVDGGQLCESHAGP